MDGFLGARRGEGWRFERILGRHEGTEAGPTVAVFGGIHGNEPAGALAAARVLGELAERRPPFRGRLVGIAGNLAALERGRRFVDRDLNRKWFSDTIAAIRRRERSEDDSVEDVQQLALLEITDDLILTASGPVVFLDLHTTSGEGPPFACLSDTLRNRAIALALPVPVILGLEEVIDGTMLGYLSDLGHVGVAIEGGQHEHPDSVTQHVAAIWLALVAAGCLKRGDVPEYDRHWGLLERATEGVPRVVDVQHRHVVGPDDVFVMEPDFASFQPIEAGTLVAKDLNGEVRSPTAGLMLLPRYQGQGEDGYFVARQVNPSWLALSATLRRWRLDRLAPLLPGVHRHPDDADRLVMARAAPSRLMTDLLHLFGYRRRRLEGGRLVFSRRRPDGAAPLSLP